MIRFTLPPHRLALIAACALTVPLGGCGNSLEPVTGKVVYDDGSSVQGGTVTFNSKTKGVNASGAIGADGTFALKFGDGQGAPAGDYKVVVVGKDTGYGNPPTVDEVYGDPVKTPLTQEIVAGKNDVTIKVKRPPTAKAPR
jgi:hypothetical protein